MDIDAIRTHTYPCANALQQRDGGVRDGVQLRVTLSVREAGRAGIRCIQIRHVCFWNGLRVRAIDELPGLQVPDPCHEVLVRHAGEIRL